MILVDANVWSETTRPEPDRGVVAWLRAHRQEAAISTITIGELLTGLALLPDGRRKAFLTKRVEGLIARAESAAMATTMATTSRPPARCPRSWQPGRGPDARSPSRSMP